MRRRILSLAAGAVMGLLLATSPPCICAQNSSNNADGLKILSAPKLFAEGVVSTAQNERNTSFSPDGQTIYFSQRSPQNPYFSAICFSRKIGGKWQKPAIAAFSGRYFDTDPFVAPDGDRLYFASDRPLPGQDANALKADLDIWMVERKNGESSWSEPVHLGASINTDAFENSPSVTRNGTLYFASNRAGGKGGFDLYSAKKSGENFSVPENLGATINSEFSETQSFVSADESILLFVSLLRADEMRRRDLFYPRGDIYISTKQNGDWSRPLHLPAPVNSVAAESTPFLSADKKFLFFTSERNFAAERLQKRVSTKDFADNLKRTENGLGNIYRVEIQIPDKK